VIVGSPPVLRRIIVHFADSPVFYHEAAGELPVSVPFPNFQHNYSKVRKARRASGTTSGSDANVAAEATTHQKQKARCPFHSSIVYFIAVAASNATFAANRTGIRGRFLARSGDPIAARVIVTA